QRACLAHVVAMHSDRGIGDQRRPPLWTCGDSAGHAGAAITLESNGREDLYPIVYVRRNNVVTEHLLPPDPLLDFERDEHRAAITAALEPLLSPSLAKPQR